MVEIVRDSCLIYEQMAEEQLLNGMIVDLLYQREINVARHNGLKTCPLCYMKHSNDGDTCGRCS